MFGIRDIEVLGAVIECGGFRAAATHLQLAQSAVSERVAALEYRLGVQLIARGGRSAQPTPAGRRFMEEGKRLLDMRDRILAEFLDEGAQSGTLRIGVAETIVHTWLPAFLSALRERVPRLRVEISVDVSGALAEHIARGDIDIAILMHERVPPFAKAVPVFTAPIDWVADTGSGLARGKVTPDDLAQSSIVTFPKGSIPYLEVERLLVDRAPRAPLLHGCASLSTALHLTRAGFGIGTLPTSLIEADLAAGRLVKLSIDESSRLTPLHFSICYVQSAGRRLRHAVIDCAHEAANVFQSTG